MTTSNDCTTDDLLSSTTNIKMPSDLLSKATHTTTFVIDMTRVDPLAVIGDTILIMIFLADIFDYIENGFRSLPCSDMSPSIVKNNVNLIPSTTTAVNADVPASGETDKSYEWLRDASLPTTKLKAFNSFGIPKKYPIIIPEEETVPNLNPIIVILTGETRYGIEKLKAVLFGDERKVGCLASSGLLSKTSFDSDIIKVVPSLCLCPTPSPFSPPLVTMTPPDSTPDGSSPYPDVSEELANKWNSQISRSYSGVNFRNAAKCQRKSHCTSQEEDWCHETFMSNYGTLECLRKTSRYLSHQVMYLDGRVLSSKALPMLIESSMISPSTITALFKPDPRSIPFILPELEDTINESFPCDKCKKVDIDGNVEDELPMLKNQPLQYLCDCRLAKTKSTYLAYYERQDPSAVRPQHVKAIIPIDSNKEPTPPWRADRVWNHLESSNDLPRIPWQVPEGVREIEFPEARRRPSVFVPKSELQDVQTINDDKSYSMVELEWCGAAMLSESVVNFWIKERNLIDEDESDEPDEIYFRLGNPTETELDHLLHCPKNLTCSCSVRDHYRESRAQEICRSLSTEQKTNLLAMTKMIIEANEDDSRSPRQKSKGRLKSSSLRQVLPNNADILDLISFITATQCDERSFGWGRNHAVEDVIMGTMNKDKAFANPDLWDALQFYDETKCNFAAEVPNVMRPDIFKSNVSIVEAPPGLLTFWMEGPQLTQKCCDFMSEIVFELASSLSRPMSCDFVVDDSNFRNVGGSPSTTDSFCHDITDGKLPRKKTCRFLHCFKDILRECLSTNGKSEEWMVVPILPAYLGTCLGNA